MGGKTPHTQNYWAMVLYGKLIWVGGCRLIMVTFAHVSEKRPDHPPILTNV